MQEEMVNEKNSRYVKSNKHCQYEILQFFFFLKIELKYWTKIDVSLELKNQK